MNYIPVLSLVTLVSAVLVLSCGKHRHRYTDSHTDTAKHFTPAIVVGVSNQGAYLGVPLRMALGSFGIRTKTLAFLPISIAKH